MFAVANYFKLSSLVQDRPQIPINAAVNFVAKILTDVNSKRQGSEILNNWAFRCQRKLFFKKLFLKEED